MLCYVDRTQVGQPQQTSVSDGTVLNSSATPNWPQNSNQPQPRPGPTPVTGQPVVSDINQTPGAQQRALAWTGHLEWQDTVS